MAYTSRFKRLDTERVELLKKMNDRPNEWTAADQKRANELVSEIAEAREQEGKVESTTAALKAAGMGKTSEKTHDENGDRISYSAPRSKSMPSPIRHASAFSDFGARVADAFKRADPVYGGVTKALNVSGSIVANVDAPIAAEPRPNFFVASALPLIAVDGASGPYLRQVERTLNADTTSLGEVKPVSVLKYDSDQWKVSTIPTISSPINRQYLSDFSGLLPAITADLGLGLARGLDKMLLTGGTAEDGTDVKGLTNTDGVETTSFAVDPLVSLRHAIGDLELLGVAPTHVVLHPTDWRDVELLKKSDDGYLLENAPQQRPARTVWGVPVILSDQLPIGKALVLDSNGAGLISREGVIISWNETGSYTEGEGEQAKLLDLYSRNLVVFRAELRAGLVLAQPAAVRLVNLKA